MATGFIGSVEIDDDFSMGDSNNPDFKNGSSATISYTAPSSISYAVVSISESASLSFSFEASLRSGCILKGFGVTVSAQRAVNFVNNDGTDNVTVNDSNESRVVLAPNETISLSASYDGPDTSLGFLDGSIGYVGSISVLEVN